MQVQKPKLEVGIYQIIDDAMFKANRTDGTGWEWCWADLRRDWMDATPNRFAYRCLPLTIANQTGWWILNPVGFTATWNGLPEPGTIDFRFDASGDEWASWINSQFGEGIVTWNTPFLFRTKPEGSRLLIVGPANEFKAGAHPLTALIESDWISMSFTMNYKLMTSGQPVRFEAGDPLFQAIPLVGNACADLESAVVTYQKLSDDPEIHRSYQEWHLGRTRFHQQKVRGEVKPDEWQKDYFQGRDVITGKEVAPEHMTKVKPPRIAFRGPVTIKESSDRPRPAPRGSASASSSASTAGRAHAVPAFALPSTGRPFDDDWRRWIAENLMLGAPRDALVQILIRNGFSAADSAVEADRAIKSPYLNGAARLVNRLRKRDWQLAMYRTLQRLRPDSGTIPRRERPSRDEFLREFYSANRPVIITGAIDDWPARSKWSLDDFESRYGDLIVEIQTGRDAARGNYEAEREKYARDVRFGDFLAMVRQAGVSNDLYMTANNDSKNKQALARLWDDIVQIPEYLDGRDPRAGFLWIGPAGTITPFHHDLTNNFMAQVIGRKRVKIAPSWDLPLMANQLHVFSDVDGRTTPAAPHPSRRDQPQILECVIGPGDVLFLPVGCLHYVESLDISVTVSFTNFAFDNDFASFYTTYQGV